MAPQSPLGRFVAASRYVMLVGIIGLIVGALEACVWSAVNAYHVLNALLRNEQYATGVVGLLHMLDAFLAAAVLLLVAVGTYDLFIAPLENVPDSLMVRSIGALKTRFASMLVLLMTVTFVEHVLSWTDPWSTLVFAGAIAIVSLAVVAYTRWSEH